MSPTRHEIGALLLTSRGLASSKGCFDSGIIAAVLVSSLIKPSADGTPTWHHQHTNSLFWSLWKHAACCCQAQRQFAEARVVVGSLPRNAKAWCPQAVVFFFCQTSWKTFTVTVNCMILQYIPGILGKTVWHGGSNLGSVAGCWEFSIFRAKASVLSVPGMASLQSCKNQRSNMIDFVFHRLLKPCLDHWYFKTIERQHHVKIVRVFWQFFFGSLACSSRDVESSSRD